MNDPANFQIGDRVKIRAIGYGDWGIVVTTSAFDPLCRVAVEGDTGNEWDFSHEELEREEPPPPAQESRP